MLTLPTTIPQSTALHSHIPPLLALRIIHRPYPTQRQQREVHWQQRLNTLFTKQRY
ncbi:hypothetical protein [Thiofilum flexile]|uniref:hypothetical protein n=1 Tax=Thiofilum flexile TaxID=125627 RepID=UPI00036B44A1|nr:hypothetical protein [Thiofilum flexile]